MSYAGRVLSIADDVAIVDIAGVRRRVSLAMLVLEDVAVRPGDWVLVHTGFAVSLMDASDAEELVELWRSMDGPEPEVLP